MEGIPGWCYSEFHIPSSCPQQTSLVELSQKAVAHGIKDKHLMDTTTPMIIVMAPKAISDLLVGPCSTM